MDEGSEVSSSQEKGIPSSRSSIPQTAVKLPGDHKLALFLLQMMYFHAN